MPSHYQLSSKVVVFPGMGGWRFLALPTRVAKEIKEAFGKSARGWGSLPVRVTVGDTKWETSIFPDKKSGTYLLPLKQSVRKAEGIGDSSTVRYELHILR